ncbi:Mor transcription activator family protein [Pasteurella multocida]|uniref:Mor transcription activator family protein n=1 Tax=Pasteurella multocida TaxID=747 RepID=UPI000352FEE4|nr:Mor transcription activator family protein [Pasteurella multocida]EPE65159.1 bacteriophage transcriptional regulator [Pasteurella multocida P1933]
MSTNADIFDEKAPEILADLAKHIETQLLTKVKSNEFNSELAKQIGIEVASHIAQSWGGGVIYIPRNLVLLLSERDRRIFNEFNGSNHRELARKYNVSMQWIYQIVKKVTKEEIARRQFDMFVEE